MQFYGWFLPLVFIVNDGQPAQVNPPVRVGQICIVGNTITRDKVIRDRLQMYPGQVVRYPDLRLAEKNLERTGLFEVNRNVRPTVTVVEGESNSEFKDIIVQVQEKWKSPLRGVRVLNRVISYVAPSYDIRMFIPWSSRKRH